MLSSFWRRKNVRLVKRLNAAIETSERLSEAYNAPKPPRVVIDTSYVEQHSQRPNIAGDYDEALYVNEPDAAAAPDAPEFSGSYGPDEAVALKNAGELENEDTAGASLDLIKDVIEQLELAEQREAEVLAELEGVRRRADELEAKAAAAHDAQRLAEAASEQAKTAAASAAAELVALRSSHGTSTASATAAAEVQARIEAKLMLEQAARRKAEQQRDETSHALSQANAELVTLRESNRPQQVASELNAAAVSSDTEMQEEIASLRSRNEELAAEAAKAREALSRAQSDIKTTRRTSDAARAEVAALREAAAKSTDIEKQVIEANAREASSTAKAASLEARVRELEAQLNGLQSENAAAQEASRKEAQRKAETAAAEITALKLAAEHLAAQRTREDSDALKRHEALVKSAESMRGHIAGLESAAATDRETAQKTLEKANEEISALRAAVKELTNERAHKTTEADQRATTASAESKALSEQLAQLKSCLNAERDAAAKAAVQAAAQIENLRLTSQEIANERAEAAAQEGATIKALQGELESQRKRADTLETDLNASEAARLNAEFDRDNARKETREVEFRLTALRHKSDMPTDTAKSVVAEPPIFKSAAAANDIKLGSTRPQDAANDEASNNAPQQNKTSSNKVPVQDVSSQTDEKVAADLPRDIDNAPQPLSFVPPLQPHETLQPQAVTQPQTTTPTAADTTLPQAPTNVEFADLSSELPESQEAINDAERRGREKRVPSRMSVTLWTEAWGQPLTCFLVDKSSRGAKIEMKPDRIFGGSNRIAVGDRLTLTFYYAHERTSVFCDVMWIDGNVLGVRYYGQFNTEIIKQRPTQRRKFGAST